MPRQPWVFWFLYQSQYFTLEPDYTVTNSKLRDPLQNRMFPLRENKLFFTKWVRSLERAPVIMPVFYTHAGWFIFLS
jgi:hypothetical protein